ncbi:hypothetical protein C8F01DRAFT_1229013 [Mycena amicta]|nr:hypothetical protein C8F01DRAFT_1229013 [Mycena amicta]
MAAFTVYCDSETDATAVQSESLPSQSSVPPTPRSNNPARPRIRVVIASYSAKENIHPRTGKRCVPGHKDAVRTVDPNANAVKRMKLDGGNSKGGKGNGKAKAKMKASRLPRLSEEFVPSQLDIDIGAAYSLDLEVDLASLLSAVSLQEERKAFVKSTSSNPEVRDYVFGAPSNINTNASRLATSTSSLPKAFSTPERQYIYSAFTFKTPSPLGLGLKSTGLQSSPTPASLSKISGKPEDGDLARFNF